MGPTLDDLRRPGFGLRLWGYDRDQVDQLLGSVITSFQRLQARLQHDADALDRATTEAGEARARAERAERERDEMAARLALALEASSAPDEDDEAAKGDAADAERRVAEAEARCRQAEAQVGALHQELAAAEQRLAHARPADHDADLDRLPLAQRAARALLQEARARAAQIVAEAEARAEAERAPGSDLRLPIRPPGRGGANGMAAAQRPAPGYSNSSGSSATIHS